jgi:hypothetical protein
VDNVRHYLQTAYMPRVQGGSFRDGYRGPATRNLGRDVAAARVALATVGRPTLVTSKLATTPGHASVDRASAIYRRLPAGCEVFYTRGHDYPALLRWLTHHLNPTCPPDALTAAHTRPAAERGPVDVSAYSRGHPARPTDGTTR